ncbi:F-box only protein 31 [Chamberlinius hualienensis]
MLIFKQFKVSIASSRRLQPTSSFCMAFYKKVLYKFGRLIGEWQPEITYYGGLVQVKYVDEKLVGIEWHATHDSHRLRRDDLFSIGLDEDENLEMLCLRGFREPHRCHISIKADGRFNVKCCLTDCHRHPEGNDEEFIRWSRINYGDDPALFNPELRLMKFLSLKNYENCFDFRRFNLPGSPVLNAVIQPGLFQGTYGYHGREIISLNYEQDGVVAKAIKVTGDSHVPFGEVTFRVDLRYSLVLNESQQESLELLLKLARTSTNILPQNLPVQPFLVPGDCHVFGFLQTPPNQCKARFSGYAQIAGHGYTNPSYSPGQWIVFNENLFAFMFLDLSYISMYHRVEEIS